MTAKAPKVYGLHGEAGVGKDTVAGLIEAHSVTVHSAYADPMYAALAAMSFKAPSREDKEKQVPGFAFTFRKALQKLGDWGRDLDPELYIKLLEAKYQEAQAQAESSDWLMTGDDWDWNYVMRDVRYSDEQQHVYSKGGIIIHVVGRAYDMQGHHTHSSEAGITLRPGDIVLDNSGTLAELETKVLSILEGTHVTL